MSQRSFTLGLPEELESRVRVAAESQGLTRNGWIRKALEAALGDAPVAGREAVSSRKGPGSTPAPPASPRASTESREESWKDGRQARLNKRLGKS